MKTSHFETRLKLLRRNCRISPWQTAWFLSLNFALAVLILSIALFALIVTCTLRDKISADTKALIGGLALIDAFFLVPLELLLWKAGPCKKLLKPTI